ncbi:epsilon DNA polymerase [Gautieria morchelliformis]|nr:epsilon DNA polymerase [Gautieria morchelliformis]
MDTNRQQVIIKVFFAKYKNTLGPQVISFVEELLDRHGIEDEDVASSVEHLAREYNRQDDAEMVVRLDVLRRVYETMQNSQTTGDEDLMDDRLDTDSQLYFVDAFEMPMWHWSPERSTFEKLSRKLTVSGSPESRVLAVRDRLNIIKQTILRNDNFSPRPFGGAGRETFLRLSTTKDLLGRTGVDFLLFGMLAHNQEGKLCLEDLDGKVALDVTIEAHTSEGFFTDGCFALVEGTYTDEEVLLVNAIGHPPCERRAETRAIYGHIDFLGKGATTVLEDNRLAEQLSEHTQLTFFILSDLWLDHPRTMVGLRKLFQNCIENNWLPKVFIMCGNFSSKGVAKGSGRNIMKYQDDFDALADLIASYPVITRRCHFVFVPGPQDPCSSTILPRRPILPSFTTRLKAKIPKVYLASNPCRIRFFSQEIVVFREDMMARMLRNLVGVKPNPGTDDLKRYLVQSVIDQCHLSPLTTHIQPTLCEYDHSLRLYPMPTTLVLADKYERYELTYEGCHVFNPGSFLGASYAFSTYYPATGKSEPSELDV